MPEAATLSSSEAVRDRPSADDAPEREPAREPESKPEAPRSAFGEIAELAGLNVVFDRDWRSSAVSQKFQDVETLDALDFLCLETASFWEALDNSTVLVSPLSMSAGATRWISCNGRTR